MQSRYIVAIVDDLQEEMLEAASAAHDLEIIAAEALSTMKVIKYKALKKLEIDFRGEFHTRMLRARSQLKSHYWKQVWTERKGQRNYGRQLISSRRSFPNQWAKLERVFKEAEKKMKEDVVDTQDLAAQVSLLERFAAEQGGYAAVLGKTNVTTENAVRDILAGK